MMDVKPVVEQLMDPATKQGSCNCGRYKECGHARPRYSVRNDNYKSDKLDAGERPCSKERAGIELSYSKTR